MARRLWCWLRGHRWQPRTWLPIGQQWICQRCGAYRIGDRDGW